MEERLSVHCYVTNGMQLKELTGFSKFVLPITVEAVVSGYYIGWCYLYGSLTGLKNELLSDMTNRQGFRKRLAEPQWSHISDCGMHLRYMSFIVNGKQIPVKTILKQLLQPTGQRQLSQKGMPVYVVLSNVHGFVKYWRQSGGCRECCPLDSFADLYITAVVSCSWVGGVVQQ